MLRSTYLLCAAVVAVGVGQPPAGIFRASLLELPRTDSVAQKQNLQAALIAIAAAKLQGAHVAVLPAGWLSVMADVETLREAALQHSIAVVATTASSAAMPTSSAARMTTSDSDVALQAILIDSTGATVASHGKRLASHGLPSTGSNFTGACAQLAVPSLMPAFGTVGVGLLLEREWFDAPPPPPPPPHTPPPFRLLNGDGDGRGRRVRPPLYTPRFHSVADCLRFFFRPANFASRGTARVAFSSPLFVSGIKPLARLVHYRLFFVVSLAI